MNHSNPVCYNNTILIVGSIPMYLPTIKIAVLVGQSSNQCRIVFVIYVGTMALRGLTKERSR